jgi:hypothetical protein
MGRNGYMNPTLVIEINRGIPAIEVQIKLIMMNTFR